MPFHVYILENAKGKFYIGQTDNLPQRLEEHNSKDPFGKRYTSKHGEWKMVWKEQHPNRSSAMQRERQIKAMKSTRWIKENLLNLVE